MRFIEASELLRGHILSPNEVRALLGLPLQQDGPSDGDAVGV